MPYDLFISYSRTDNVTGRITQLVERIKTDFAPFAKRELVPFFDKQEIAGMQDWRQRILQGLRESRLLLEITLYLGQVLPRKRLVAERADTYTDLSYRVGFLFQAHLDLFVARPERCQFRPQ